MADSTLQAFLKNAATYLNCHGSENWSTRVTIGSGWANLHIEKEGDEYIANIEVGCTTDHLGGPKSESFEASEYRILPSFSVVITDPSFSDITALLSKVRADEQALGKAFREKWSEYTGA